MKYVLTIAGSDSCGGAGIQADIKTITSLGAHALTAITTVTAQNSLGVTAIHRIPARFISKQIETVIQDIIPDAVKVGMLCTMAAVREVAGMIKRYKISNVVVDPVMRASTGKLLLEEEAIHVFRDLLLPLSRVVTPNLEEAGILTGKEIRSLKDMERASRTIKKNGPDVVITGGHLNKRCTDLLYDGEEMTYFHGSKIETRHTHGSGCIFSSALATHLAMEGDVIKAAKFAHDFTRKGIKAGYPCGMGEGPVRPW